MYDPLKLCTSEERDGKTWHVADPAVVLPETLERIVEVLGDNKWKVSPPDELINWGDDDPSVASKAMVEQASNIPAIAWAAALKEKSEKAEKEDVEARAMALSLAWSWFKRALSLKTGKTVLLHITRDEKYKE